MKPFFLTLFILETVSFVANSQSALTNHSLPYETSQLPLGGNTWAYGSTKGQGLLTNKGIDNWNYRAVYFITYLRINTPGTMQVKLKAKTEMPCKLSLTIA